MGASGGFEFRFSLKKGKVISSCMDSTTCIENMDEGDMHVYGLSKSIVRAENLMQAKS